MAPLAALKKLFRRLARSPWLSVLACGVVALLVSATFTAVRVPVPKVHDEFSYLLAADTFASGRVTNPPHPQWQHFESFHILQQPSYTSKYQPGQGLALALGQWLTGEPIVGAWLATALAAAAMCWMLQGWVPGRWAMLGGMLVALHGMIQVRWALSYWGGSLPLAGGALMFGGLARTLRQPRLSSSLLMATGAVLLGATRPFEGFIVGLSVTLALVIWMIGKQRPSWSVLCGRVVLPSLLVLAVGVGGLGYYNWRVTGDALQMPYQVHQAEYSYSPLFVWKRLGEPPEYRHETMKHFHTGWEVEDYQQQQTLTGWLGAKSQGLWQLGKFFLGSALWVPLLMIVPLLRRKELRFVWLALAAFVAAESMVPWTMPHYYAAIVPLLFLLVVEGMRQLVALRREGHAWARLAVPAVVVLHVAALPALLYQYAGWQPSEWQFHRAELKQKLGQTPGKHLVLVHYQADHNSHQEWVYNRADIDGAKVVWARCMTPEKVAELVQSFGDRTVWLLEADEPEPALVKLDPAAPESHYSKLKP